MTTYDPLKIFSSRQTQACYGSQRDFDKLLAKSCRFTNENSIFFFLHQKYTLFLEKNIFPSPNQFPLALAQAQKLFLFVFMGVFVFESLEIQPHNFINMQTHLLHKKYFFGTPLFHSAVCTKSTDYGRPMKPFYIKILCPCFPHTWPELILRSKSNKQRTLQCILISGTH